MPHILTLTFVNGRGIVPTLECTEPQDASKSRCRSPYPENCNVVDVFEWDSACAIEGYQGPSLDACKIVIAVHAGRIGTHSETCHRYHAACLAYLIRDLLDAEWEGITVTGLGPKRVGTDDA